MLLKNIDLEKGLANGSRGVIVGFQRPKNERYACIAQYDDCSYITVFSYKFMIVFTHSIKHAFVSDVPTGFKKMELPVVKFDSMKAVGQECDGDSAEGNNDNEFIIHPEGEMLSCSSFVLHFQLFLTLSHAHVIVRMGK